ncbi:hypothetical protein F5X68DRAFT_56394 [Plectosphaerella plurivora]|uniref:Uncharacterized protein n=1 Tax=Plectosphaerella plurivora TaxID=936078 RepID=A0A9P8V1Q9_9PEZI|nr:hypothetical protein F5X68DRAFT_56394 [Plectosphaerella plurivora]
MLAWAPLGLRFCRALPIPTASLPIVGRPRMQLFEQPSRTECKTRARVAATRQTPARCGRCLANTPDRSDKCLRTRLDIEARRMASLLSRCQPPAGPGCPLGLVRFRVVLGARREPAAGLPRISPLIHPPTAEQPLDLRGQRKCQGTDATPSARFGLFLLPRGGC